MRTIPDVPALIGMRPDGLPVVRAGLMPLADSAPLIVASLLGFDVRHGIRLQLSRESSWAALRDRLLRGELDVAQLLYGMAYGVHMGIGGARADMAVLMTLNRNGQGISLSRQLFDAGVSDLDALRRWVLRGERRLTFAHTFPTGTHAMWLYYWMASAGIDPLEDVRTIVVPPPAMVANTRDGRMDGFSVGEPWNTQGIAERVSVHAAASQDVWPDHPEKVLGATAAFVDARPERSRAAVAAVLEACRWLDASAANRLLAAQAIVAHGWIDAPIDHVAERMTGLYRDGRGRRWTDRNCVAFHGDGDVNFPWLSDGMWFLTQHVRWGLLAGHPDYRAVAGAVNRIDLYRDAAAQAQVPVPAGTLRISTLIDGTRWDGSDPAAYADAFAIRAPARRRSAA